VTVSEFKGTVPARLRGVISHGITCLGVRYIGIREYYTDANGEDKPGKKGVSLNEEQVRRVCPLLPHILLNSRRRYSGRYSRRTWTQSTSCSAARVKTRNERLLPIPSCPSGSMSLLLMLFALSLSRVHRNNRLYHTRAPHIKPAAASLAPRNPRVLSPWVQWRSLTSDADVSIYVSASPSERNVRSKCLACDLAKSA
jgi:hypothetical protein